jgi:S-adenosylmethionine synthetase
VRAHFDLRPYGIIKMLDLVHPMYRATAAYGHFGREPVHMTYKWKEFIAGKKVEKSEGGGVLASGARSSRSRR